MKFLISMSAIKYAAKLSASFAAASNDLAELRCLKIEAADGKLTITSFNRTAWVHLLVAGADVVRPGVALIEAEAFRRWASAGSDAAPLEVDVVGPNANLKNGRATCKMPTLDVAKYSDPAYSQATSHTHATLPAKDLVAGLGSVSFAMDRKEGTKKVRTDVVYFDIDRSGLHLVATNDKALSEVLLAAIVQGDDISQSIPYSSAQLLTPLLESVGDGEATIKMSRAECLIETERFRFGTRLIDGKQFPWRSMFKRLAEGAERIAIPVKETIAAIRQVQAADPAEFRLRLAFDAGGLSVGFAEKAESIVDIPGNTTEMSFTTQPEFIVDMLNVVSRRELPLTVEWGMNTGTNKIALFRPGTNWRYTVTTLIDPSGDKK